MVLELTPCGRPSVKKNKVNAKYGSNYSSSCSAEKIQCLKRAGPRDSRASQMTVTIVGSNLAQEGRSTGAACSWMESAVGCSEPGGGGGGTCWRSLRGRAGGIDVLED